MCGVLFTWWAGRHNNGAIVERPRGGNVNTRVVKLQPIEPVTEPEKGGGNKVVDGKVVLETG